jgi:predicted alpha/beta-hydrolase family hydrolase
MSMAESPPFESFSDMASDPPVRGFLHRPVSPSGDGLALTHGAGGNCQAQLLVALAEAFSGKGFVVLRYNLPFRLAKSFGPPRPGTAARDRDGIKNAVSAVRQLVSGRVFAGGHSYGGRQTTMRSAEEPGLMQGLLLSSYPLHPPGKPDRLRVEHFPELQTPALFVNGTRDPFGTIDEMKAALRLIPAKTTLLPVEGAGHDLGFKGTSGPTDLAARVLAEFQDLFA